MIDIKHLPVRRGKVPLRIAQGHFATNHSHINYYVDITFNKTRLSEAKDTAYELVSHFISSLSRLCLEERPTEQRYTLSIKLVLPPAFSPYTTLSPVPKLTVALS